MRIRPYNVPDRDRIRDILEGSKTFTDEEVVVALSVLDEAQKSPESGDYTVYCAQDEQEIVFGYICFGPIPMTDRCYDLYWICVDRTRKKRGIGTSLMEAMETDLRKRRVRHVYIDTSSTPPYDDARSFYEKHGYRSVSVFPDYYQAGDDKVVYRKIF